MFPTYPLKKGSMFPVELKKELHVHVARLPKNKFCFPFTPKKSSLTQTNF